MGNKDENTTLQEEQQTLLERHSLKKRLMLLFKSYYSENEANREQMKNLLPRRQTENRNLIRGSLILN